MPIRRRYRRIKRKTRRRQHGGTTKRQEFLASGKKMTIKADPNRGKGTAKCAPKPDGLGYTCFSRTSLEKLRNLWNARNPDRKIETTNAKDIWYKLNENLKSSCARETCWLNEEFVKRGLDKDPELARELKEMTFAPTAPASWKRNKNEWLSSTDILHVMQQYEKSYKCFNFMGPSPIDYDTRKMYGECVWEELCKFDLAKEHKRGIWKIGVVFNLDPHYKSGSHWVSLFLNLRTGEVCYFDSGGDAIPRQIKKLATTMINQAEALGIKVELKVNKKEHQYGDTECGMYCLYFIIEMLKDRGWDYFQSKRISDEDVEKLRNEYFN